MHADVTFPIERATPAHGAPFVGCSPDALVAAPRPVARVAISAWKAVTALGSARATWKRLLDGEAIDDHARVPRGRPGRRALALARMAAAPLTGEGFDRGAGLVVGTSKGSVETWLTPPPDPGRPTSDNPGGGLTTAGLADIGGELAALLCRAGGPVITLSAACASGLHALVRGAMMIRSGEARQVLVVATEASVHPLFLGSFQRLGVLAKPGAGCRPFDRNRAGFYMSEAAAAVLLEAVEPDGSLPSRRSALRQRRFPHPPVFLENFALGGDATHLTGGDPHARVLRRLLARVIDGRPVDLVHAHGTGTELNDATELAAIDDTVVPAGPHPTVVYSHKAALGHSLGASGLLSVVINCMSHAAGEIPPNVRTTEPLPAARVAVPRGVTRRPVRRSLAVAAGFGGPTAVVSLVSP
jgi:3-oxoacyl-[acyl-carrier-protein] synthase II